jgi:4-hydroxybenzoate polyprenyltransferase
VTATTAPLPSPASASNPVQAFLRLVMIEHSIFALPFAYIAALTAMAPGGVHWVDLLLISIAMVAARTFAMAANRIVDRALDAANPRTARRELVTGAVSLRTAYVGSAVSLVVFLVMAALLSRLCLELAPVALVPLVLYPYGKRFTWLCHGLLGLAQAVAPIGAWIAITGHWSWAATALGVGVGLWIGGFDLIYALQDMAHDRAHGVYSLPARFGPRVALNVSSASHAVTFGLFVAFGLAENLGPIWYVGLGLVAVLFAYEHLIVTPTDWSRLNRAFFTLNGFIGIALFAFALVDLVVHGHLSH